MKPAQRAWQLLLITGTLGFSWLGLQVVHEAGHVLHAWAGGGTVARVVLYPTTISETLVAPNPRPGFVAAGGPIWGCLIPLAIWGVLWLSARRYAFLGRFFAGACLVANGVYIGASVFGNCLAECGISHSLAAGRDLDGPVILANGGTVWQLSLFAMVATVTGFYIWYGLGPDFGLGQPGRRVDRRAAAVAAGLLVLLVLVECALAG